MEEKKENMVTRKDIINHLLSLETQHLKMLYLKKMKRIKRKRR